MKRWKKICAIVTCCMLVSGCSGTGVSTDVAGVEEQTENTVSQENDDNEPDSTDDTQNQDDTQSSQNDDLGIRRGDRNGKGGGRNAEYQRQRQHCRQDQREAALFRRLWRF